MKRIRFGHVIGFITLLLIIVVIIISYIQDIDLKNNSKYTIGVTIKLTTTARSGYNVFYTYYVNKKKYNGLTSCGDGKGLLVPEGRYYVVFSNKNPVNSKLLVDSPVSDSIFQSPPEGWAKLPKSPR